MTTMPCTECRAGKHTNCTTWALDDNDRDVDCPCTCREDG